MGRKDKDTPQKTPEQEALEKHVDAMMDPKKPDPKSSASTNEPKITAVATPAAEPNGPGTAPQLSARLRKQIGATDASTKPLSIDKLDELTEQITKAEKPKKHKKAAKKPGPEPEAPTEATENPAESGTDLEDEQTDKAVDDIVAYEGDVVLAVADSTAEKHNREAATGGKPEGHPVLSTLLWTCVAIAAILIAALGALLLMGDSLANKLGL